MLRLGLAYCTVTGIPAAAVSFAAASDICVAESGWSAASATPTIRPEPSSGTANELVANPNFRRSCVKTRSRAETSFACEYFAGWTCISEASTLRLVRAAPRNRWY
jgi:hypothetical protein